MGVCNCMELMALRELRTTALIGPQKLRKRERFGEETLMDLPEQSHSCADSSSAGMKRESLKVGGINLRMKDVIS